MTYEVEPLEYSDVERRVLEVVRKHGPIEPVEVIARMNGRAGMHFDEHRMFAIMEGLRDRFPEKLSHAGPRKFAYHKLS